MKRALIRGLFGLVLSLGVLAPQPAGAKKELPAVVTACTQTITAAPFTISQPGVYCFAGDIVVNLSGGTGDSEAIRVAANDVTIEMNGWRLENSSGPAVRAFGIVSVGQVNTVIRNGLIRGFERCVDVEGDQGHVIEAVRVDRCWITGVVANGDNVVVRDTVVSNVGGSTLFPTVANAVSMVGNGGRILGNEVTNVLHDSTTSQAAGIIVQGDGWVLEANRVSNAKQGFGLAGSGVYRDNTAANITTSPFVVISGAPVNGGGNVP